MDKVLVIGLDGGTFDLLDPWMEAGHLPVLRSIRDAGVCAPLTSTVPPVTVPAWCSFITGKNPGKHGIAEFMIKKPGSYEEQPINASVRDGKSFWRLLGEQGERVVVLNIPTTYPVEPVEGAMIAGFLTPAGRRDFVYPDGLLEEIEAKFGPYYLYFRTVESAGGLSERGADILLKECVEMVRYKFDVARYLVDKYDATFVAIHVWGTDRLQHEFMHIMSPDPEHPMHDPDMASRLSGRILDYYRRVDRLIGELADAMGQGTSILVASDHGHGPIHRIIDLNVWLLEEGYLVLKRSLGTRMRKFLWRRGFNLGTLLRLFTRVVKYLPTIRGNTPFESLTAFRVGQRRPFLLSFNDVDWSRTRAYAKTGTGQIVINLRGREPEGIVEPGAGYTALCREIADKLSGMRDPERGVKVEADVRLREELYHGPHYEEMPDISYLPMASRYMAVNLSGFTLNRVFSDNHILSGNHYQHGIFMAKGEAFRKGIGVQGMEIIDLAPTILYLMGKPVPEDMDGKVHEAIFEEEFVRTHPVRTGLPATSERERSFVSKDDEEDIKKKLKELGYLG